MAPSNQLFVPVSDDVRALLAVPYSSSILPSSALPFPVHDPHPRLTIALHALWSNMSSFLGLGDFNRPSFRPPANNPGMVPGEALAHFLPFLVCHFILFFMYGGLIFVVFPNLQKRYYAILEECKAECEVGYKVRLWALLFTSLCVRREDRALVSEALYCLPEIQVREIEAVSSLLYIFLSIFLMSLIFRTISSIPTVSLVMYWSLTLRFLDSHARRYISPRRNSQILVSAFC